MRWPKYWSFSFSTIPSKEHPGLIFFRMDWLDLLAAQGTLKSLLQHHSSKASILRCSAFFTVQLSHPYMTTGKTIALTRWTFVGKVMSLLFNMHLPLPEANLLTAVLLWEGASHTQFCTEKSLGMWGHPESQQSCRCYSHAFWETNSLRRTMQIVECSLLPWWAQGRVSS